MNTEIFREDGRTPIRTVADVSNPSCVSESPSYPDVSESGALSSLSIYQLLFKPKPETVSMVGENLPLLSPHVSPSLLSQFSQLE